MSIKSTAAKLFAQKIYKTHVSNKQLFLKNSTNTNYNNTNHTNNKSISQTFRWFFLHSIINWIITFLTLYFIKYFAIL